MTSKQICGSGSEGKATNFHITSTVLLLKKSKAPTVKIPTSMCLSMKCKPVQLSTAQQHELEHYNLDQLSQQSTLIQNHILNLITIKKIAF